MPKDIEEIIVEETPVEEPIEEPKEEPKEEPEEVAPALDAMIPGAKIKQFQNEAALQAALEENFPGVSLSGVYAKDEDGNLVLKYYKVKAEAKDIDEKAVSDFVQAFEVAVDKTTEALMQQARDDASALDGISAWKKEIEKRLAAIEDKIG